MKKLAAMMLSMVLLAGSFVTIGCSRKTQTAGAEAQAVEKRSETVSPEASTLAFSAAMSLASTSG